MQTRDHEAAAPHVVMPFGEQDHGVGEVWVGEGVHLPQTLGSEPVDRRLVDEIAQPGCVCLPVGSVVIDDDLFRLRFRCGVGLVPSRISRTRATRGVWSSAGSGMFDIVSSHPTPQATAATITAKNSITPRTTPSNGKDKMPQPSRTELIRNSPNQVPPSVQIEPSDPCFRCGWRLCGVAVMTRTPTSSLYAGTGILGRV